MKLINEKIKELFALCRKHKVKSLYVFGSILTNHFKESSDIDFLVNFDDEEVEDPYINFFDMIEALEALFKRKIDLVDESAITNKIFLQEVNATKQLLYGQK